MMVAMICILSLEAHSTKKGLAAPYSSSTTPSLFTPASCFSSLRSLIKNLLLTTSMNGASEQTLSWEKSNGRGRNKRKKGSFVSQQNSVFCLLKTYTRCGR